MNDVFLSVSFRFQRENKTPTTQDAIARPVFQNNPANRKKSSKETSKQKQKGRKGPDRKSPAFLTW